jgi:gliding motility-associated-like protein
VVALLKKNWIFVFLLMTGVHLFAQVDMPPEVFVSGRQSYCPESDINIGSNFTITDPDSAGIDQFFIQISTGYQINIDELRLTGNHPSINAEWNVAEGKMTLTPASGGIMSYINLQAAVRDVVYRSLNNQVAGEKFFSFNISPANYLPSNGHFYEFVPQVGITWLNARNSAEERTFFGMQGYLATITSADEAQITGEQSPGAGWIGGSDLGNEGTWRWMTGPEEGTIFWLGGPDGSPVGFAFWNAGEPNDLDGEDYAHVTDPSVGQPGSWNDLPLTGGSGLYEAKGYIVEYGGMPGDPNLNISGSTSIYVPQIETSFNGEICVFGTTTISAIPTEGDVYWYDQMEGGNLLFIGQVFETPELTETTIYYAAVTVNGCSTIPRTPVEAVVNPFPVITGTEGALICEGQTAAITATSDSGSIQWFETMTSTEPLFTGGLFITPELFENTTYYVEADTNGCSSGTRLPVDVTVDDIFPTFDLVETATICLDQGFVFVEATNPGGTYFYQWRDETDNLIGSAQGIQISSAGVYSVIAISDAGCVSDVKILTVIESELPNFTGDNITIDDAGDNNSIVIDTNGLGRGDYEFALDSSTGPFTTDTVFENIAPGLHTLYIRDNGGCGVASFQFSVLDYPTFFTPNGDGVNDLWQLKGIDRSFYMVSEIQIYNRYGVLVARLDASSAGWNGISKGWRLPSNDYWFSVKLTDINGVTIERKGHFSLLRR